MTKYKIVNFEIFFKKTAKYFGFVKNGITFASSTDSKVRMTEQKRMFNNYYTVYNMVDSRKRQRFLRLSLSMAFFAVLASCVSEDEAGPVFEDKSGSLSFTYVVTQDGQIKTRSEIEGGGFVTSNETEAKLDPNKPFGLVGVNADNYSLLIDNMPVHERGGSRSLDFESRAWSGDTRILMSAYYPYVDDVQMMDNNHSYIIPYKNEDREAGPLISQTVEKRISYMDVVPLVFRHITNEICFAVSDITENDSLKGHIRLRKLIAHNIATEGYFIDTIGTGNGVWKHQSMHKDILVYEGDSQVGIGTENELYVGKDVLVSRFGQSNRFYSIPEEIRMGKQFIEVVFDVEPFTCDGVRYSGLKNEVQKFPIYGVLPNNEYEYGKQYIFHLGLNLGTLYQEIQFSATVADWENSYSTGSSQWESKIYVKENDF